MLSVSLFRPDCEEMFRFLVLQELHLLSVLCLSCSQSSVDDIHQHTQVGTVSLIVQPRISVVFLPNLLRVQAGFWQTRGYNMSVIPAGGTLPKEIVCKFKINLGYVLKPYLYRKSLKFNQKVNQLKK